MKSIMDRVFSEDPEQSIALWDGTTRCAPGKYNRVRRGQLMASINTWKSPEYRSLGVKDAEMGVLEDFLDQTMPENAGGILHHVSGEIVLSQMG